MAPLSIWYRFYVFGGFGPWPEHVTDYTGVTFTVDPRAGDRRGWNNQLVRRLFVFGGRMGHRLNDLHCLDLDTAHWTHLEAADPAAPLPQGRSWHSVTPLLDDQLLIYGGFNDMDEPLDDPWVYEVNAARWRSVHSWLPAPAVRMWHTAAAAAPGEVHVLGGLETSIFARRPAHFASRVVVIQRTPKSLLSSAAGRSVALMGNRERRGAGSRPAAVTR
ncbi:kelch domain-containing protein 2-like [Pollicipes pollicipes]|uniref:kelch domain-containing protein 2-like n=1 Tax=Pollicipes pollicipes TaxID=41117 RepID=UPI00188560E2|nr:kelch domain-containing protein 2-like [Pollicipes pollicipes]